MNDDEKGDLYLTPWARKALWQSIEHWLENWANQKDAHIFGPACSLCRRFCTAGSCTGCPIKEVTGCDFCGDTPWKTVNKARDRYLSRPLDTAPAGETRLLEALRDAITDEYQFLVDLALRDVEFGYAPEENNDE